MVGPQICCLANSVDGGGSNPLDGSQNYESLPKLSVSSMGNSIGGDPISGRMVPRLSLSLVSDRSF